jgi:hypothetical protein
MASLGIRDTAILVGYNPEGTCVYSTQLPLHEYWDGDHVWDSGEGVKGLRLERIKGFLFGSEGELFQEFESIFDVLSGSYKSGWAKHDDGTERHDVP